MNETYYLIGTFKRTNGIYIILNLVEKKAYVGLAKSMAARALDHFKAICTEQVADDNTNLIEEVNKEFLHIPVWYPNDNTMGMVPDAYLRYLESILICIVRDAGFMLYNTAKKDTNEAEIIANYQRDGLDSFDDYQAAKTKYIQIFGMMRECIRRVLSEAFNMETDNILELLAAMSREEREDLWKKTVKSFPKKSGPYVLSKVPGRKYCHDKNYAKVNKMLSSFLISKEKLERLGINWESRSIFDEELRAQWKQLLVISNFGSHNGEAPYEILKMMDMDIHHSEDGCCYWALKNFKEETLRQKVLEQLGGKHLPIYVILKTTTSDNSGGDKKAESLEKILTEEDIQEKAETMRKTNPSDLMHSYLNVEGKWELLPKGLSYVTVPSNRKAVAFRFSRFWTCKEGFDFNEAQRDRIFNVGGKIVASQCPTYYSDLNDALLEEQKMEWTEQDEVSCLIAKLEYPYLVEVSHTSTLRSYLNGWEDGAYSPRILLKSKGTLIRRDKKILAAYAFRGDKVWKLDSVSEGITYENILNEDDAQLEQKIMQEGVECDDYSIEFSAQYEVIKIRYLNGDTEEIRIDRSYDPRTAKTNTGFGDAADFFHKAIRYYGFPDPDSESMYAFRYIPMNSTGTVPPFLFDSIE